jgi:DNA-binding CsgD family transcriptional regulator/N-acetylneuraminic acid mutarotase
MAEEQRPLSEREMEVIRLVADGATNRQIARELVISVNTVKIHLRNIFEKLNVQSRTEAALCAVREGWVTVGPPTVEPETTVEAAVEEEPVERISLAKRITFVVAALLVLVIAFFPQTEMTASSSEVSNDFTNRPASRGQLAVRFEVSRWVSRAQMSTPRERLAMAIHEDKIYAIAGDTPGGSTGVVEIYSPDDNVWKAGKSKPTPVSNVAAAVVDGLIYVPGGYTSAGEVITTTEVYDPAHDTWDTRAPLPAPLCAYAIAAVDGKLFIFGGWDGDSYVASVYEYDPQEDGWIAKTAMSMARGFAAAGVVEDKIYVVGGYDGRTEFALCEEYDPAKDDGTRVPWTIKAPMSVGRGGLGVTVVRKNLYAIGGGWQSYLVHNERYNPDTNTWANFETPITAEWRNLGVVATEAKIYAIGGYSGEYLSDNQEYQALFHLYLPTAP